MRKVIFTILSVLALTSAVSGQIPTQFSGDTAKFTAEMTAFMGTLVSKPEKAEVDLFNSLYDSTVFSRQVKDKIINVASQLRGRRVSHVPGFVYYLRTLTDFIETDQDQEEIDAWLEGLSEMAFNPRFSNASVEKFIEVTGLLMVDNTIYKAGTVRWKTRNGTVQFARDTVLKIDIKAVTLTAYLGKDSTSVMNFTGTYFPDLFLLRCDEGKVTWEKAGYDPSAVFAKVSGFTIDVTKSEFTCDSALLTHPTYFKTPVAGRLTDRAVEIISPDRATMPRFETYENRFFIDEIYRGVDYEGGLALEGAIVRGTGSDWFPASVKLYREDTLAIKIVSRNFILSHSLSRHRLDLSLQPGFLLQHGDQGGRHVPYLKPAVAKPLFRLIPQYGPLLRTPAVGHEQAHNNHVEDKGFFNRFSEIRIGLILQRGQLLQTYEDG